MSTQKSATRLTVQPAASRFDASGFCFEGRGRMACKTPVEIMQLLKKFSKAARYRWMANKIMRDLCLQIKAMRKQRGWSQARLAKEAGVNLISVFRLEHIPWVTWPTITTLIKLAAAFDVALIVRFASWSEFISSYCAMPQIETGLSSNSLCPKNFAEELGLIAHGDSEGRS